jgi:hypothetical protein
MVARTRLAKGLTFDPTELLLLFLTVSGAISEATTKSAITKKVATKKVAGKKDTKKSAKKVYKIRDKVSVVWKYEDLTYQTHEGTIIAIDSMKEKATVLYDDGEKWKHDFRFLNKIRE